MTKLNADKAVISRILNRLTKQAAYLPDNTQSIVSQTDPATFRRYEQHPNQTGSFYKDVDAVGNTSGDFTTSTSSLIPALARAAFSTRPATHLAYDLTRNGVLRKSLANMRALAANRQPVKSVEPPRRPFTEKDARRIFRPMMDRTFY